MPWNQNRLLQPSWRHAVTETYRSEIGNIREYIKLDMVRYDYEIGDPLNGVASHECCLSLRSGIG